MTALEKIFFYFNTVSNFSEILISIPCVLLSIVIHEVSHGYTAYKMGDPTARNFGRLSLNPLKHIDPIGAICMLFFHFGWARPVPINSRNFRNPKRGMALTALAGPVSNLILAFLGMLSFYALIALYSLFPESYEMADIICKFLAYVLVFFQMATIMNVSFAVFNFIPVPPLDGSRILYTFLPPKYYFGVMKYERYIAIAIMVLLYIGFLDMPLAFTRDIILKGMYRIIQFLPFV